MKQIFNSEELIGKTIEDFYFSEEELWIKFTDSSFVVIETDDGINVSYNVKDKTNSELVKIKVITQEEFNTALEEQRAKWRKETENRLKVKDEHDRELYKVLHKKYGNQGLTD